MISDLKAFLDEKVDFYNRPSFIQSDPIVVPHGFSNKQDKEISAFFAATFAWGQRPTIINKSLELMGLMDNAPHNFILHHSEQDLQSLLKFKHRTFNTTDLLWFIHFLKKHYAKFESLEDAFLLNPSNTEFDTMQALKQFHKYFFDEDIAPARTKKHVSTPVRKSSCKRLNMFLRWMVRKDDKGVDFGIWTRIPASALICPFDLHVARVSRSLGLVHRKQDDWQAALELTNSLRVFDAKDPVRYDFALFGLGVFEKF
jgi:uncharacterized protein (TIGR02757 family)